MSMDRRRFTGIFAGLLAGAATPAVRRAAAEPAQGPDAPDVPASIRNLRPLAGGVTPISAAERQARIEQARRLMHEAGMDALVLEPGSSLYYYTAVGWGLSERPFVAVMSVQGEMAYVCPAFEEARAREQVGPGATVRAWQEDESPYRLVAGILRDLGQTTGRIGIEERARFFVFDGLRQEAPGAQLVRADQVTTGCRMIKSPAELALLQRANDITIAAGRAAFAELREGMSPAELARNMSAAMSRLGGAEAGALVVFGAYTAFPHGTVQPQQLRVGDVVLVDSGCSVEGYHSDVTRTTVFGRPTQRQTDVWNLERRAQDAAFRAAQVGATCASVDDAARQVITEAGFGPDYRVPGLPHRTGHGIGLEGHEWTNLVRGNKTRLQAGMCFSDEPMIAIPGEFGIRLEDCFYMTADGPRLFSRQSPSIEQPFA